MKVVITGGAGFIGSRICVELSQRGYDVVTLDNLERATAVHRLKKRRHFAKLRITIANQMR